MTLFHPVTVFSTWKANMLLKSRAGPLRVPLLSLCHVVPLNDGNGHLTIPTIKERYYGAFNTSD